MNFVSIQLKEIQWSLYFKTARSASKMWYLIEGVLK